MVFIQIGIAFFDDAHGGKKRPFGVAGGEIGAKKIHDKDNKREQRNFPERCFGEIHREMFGLHDCMCYVTLFMKRMQ